MELKYLSKSNIDDHFKTMAMSLVDVIEKNNAMSELKRIKIENLKQLIVDLEDYRPKSHVKEGKVNLIKYLSHFVEIPIEEHDEIELAQLESEYILSSINNHMHKKGYTAKLVWLWGLLFLLPVDIILWIFIGEYYFYIPIISLPFVIKQIRSEIKAKRSNRLW
ncbi:hypothetical protein [Psychroflexus montanilacus]|uniref:hypothetical protein n=1 Tax=Psychroflexus montanilacus TaxID=2873598 RepID=UPI001CCFCBD4|nr:hypothetical protein [Psychroflexus montanilacus]MBZ9652673.1 hypothetical protein [Psychroflexus montanilacus]